MLRDTSLLKQTSSDQAPMSQMAPNDRQRPPFCFFLKAKVIFFIESWAYGRTEKNDEWMYDEMGVDLSAKSSFPHNKFSFFVIFWVFCVKNYGKWHKSLFEGINSKGKV